MPLSDPSNRKGYEEAAGCRHHLREQQRRGRRSETGERQFNLSIIEMGFSRLIGVNAHKVHAGAPISSGPSANGDWDSVYGPIFLPGRATSAVGMRRGCIS